MRGLQKVAYSAGSPLGCGKTFPNWLYLALLKILCKARLHGYSKGLQTQPLKDPVVIDGHSGGRFQRSVTQDKDHPHMSTQHIVIYIYIHTEAHLICSYVSS